MCGRASVVTDPRKIAKELLAELAPGAEEGWEKRYNFAPTQQSVIVVPGGSNGRLVEPATWGWKRTVGPPRERGKTREKLVINAMAETAADKPMFRRALREHRGVLPVTLVALR